VADRDDNPAGKQRVEPGRGREAPTSIIGQFIAAAREVSSRVHLLRPETYKAAFKRVVQLLKRVACFVGFIVQGVMLH
jgi:hypothetical protein